MLLIGLVNYRQSHNLGSSTCATLTCRTALVAALHSHFAVVGQVRKERTIYLLGIHKIHLDQLEGDCFIEIESIDRHAAYTSQQLKALCFEMKEKLEIADADLVPTWYFRNG